ncbi:hypothetical protein DFH28DRAFT_1143082 [Melampsora americana]|nr:hypothetical protein DFH28DRAFT_1143082 [Melampsora americana]
MSTLEPAFYSTTSSIEPEKRYSHLSGLDFLRALLTDIKTVDRTSFNYLYVISPHSQAPLNTLIDRYLLAKLLWGPGKREINQSKSFNFGHLKLLGNLKDEFVENKWIGRIEFVNESCARLGFDHLKYNLHQKFNESKVQAEEKIQYECFNHSISSDVWTWEEISEKGMIEAEWLAMKKPKDFHFGGYQADRRKRKVHFQPKQNLLQPTKLEINYLLESITLETILQSLLLSKAYRKCQLIFTDTVPCKIAYSKIFQSLKVVKEKSILEKLGSCADCLIPDQSQLDHDDNRNVWNHAVEWNTDQISNFAQSICQPMISNPCTINSNISTHQSKSYNPSSFALPKKWQIQIVLGRNLPIIQDPRSANLRSFLLTNVIRHPSSQGFFNLPYSVHLGTEGGSRFRTMVLIFYKLDSHKMTSKDEIKLEADGEILRRQLKEVCHKFNCTEHLLMYGKRKIRWQYLDLAYSAADRTSHHDLYKELHDAKKFKLMIHQIGFHNSLSDPSDNTRNDLSDDNQLRYRNLFAIPGGFKHLSRRHRGRTNSNAATLLDDEIVDTTDSGSSLEIEKTDGEEEEVHHEWIGFERVENQDYRAIKEQLEDEIFELECKKNEPEEGLKSLAFESAQSVSDRRRIEIQEKQRRRRQGRRRKRRKASEDVDESEESVDEEEGGEIDWQKRKRRMRKIRGMNDEEDETDSTGIITNPNFITNTEAIARRHARPPEREPGAVL